MQSGHAKTKNWILEYIPTSARIPEALIGWVSSHDTLNQVRIHFECKEDAISFAQKHDFEYTLSESNDRKVKPRNYGDNFKYIPTDGKSA